MNKDKFYFAKNDPTRYNLRKHLLLNDYVEVDHPKIADFSDENIGVNDIALRNLEYKHLLANLLQRHDLHFSPLTFCINDYNFPQVLTVLRQECSSYEGLWIYKPATLNNGEGIKLFSHIDEIDLRYQTLKRLGGDFVIQRYIDNPHLLNGHKYTIRMYVILSNYAGYKLYDHGYYNIGLLKYPGKNAVENLAAHLTNEHLTEPLPNVMQMPTSKVPEFSLLMSRIRSIVNNTIEAFSASVPDYFAPSNIRAFDILGFDFLLDEAMNLWLIEVNHGPWFPTTEPHSLQSHLYEQFWQFVVNEFVKYNQFV